MSERYICVPPRVRRGQLYEADYPFPRIKGEGRDALFLTHLAQFEEVCRKQSFSMGCFAGVLVETVRRFYGDDRIQPYEGTAHLYGNSAGLYAAWIALYEGMRRICTPQMSFLTDFDNGFILMGTGMGDKDIRQAILRLPLLQGAVATMFCSGGNVLLQEKPEDTLIVLSVPRCAPELSSYGDIRQTLFAEQRILHELLAGGPSFPLADAT